MKHLLSSLLLATLAGFLARAGERGHCLEVSVEPWFGGDTLTFDTLEHQAASGQVISVTRLDFLLSNITLHRTDGAWLGLTNWAAYLSPREGRTRFSLEQVPPGTYDRIRFFVGLPPGMNHRDPAEYPADDPLNPEVNGLHWGWMGGYVFLALEGHWKAQGVPSGPAKTASAGRAFEAGYSFHLATDRQLMKIELPVSLDLSADRSLQLLLNVDGILNQPHVIALTSDFDSTHSRTNDILADWLRENVEHAFAVGKVSSLPPTASPAGGTNNGVIAPDATPYRLTISSFFPRPALPADNPLTEQGVELGRRLFFDPRLSVNNSQSCASCHTPTRAFTDGKATSLGTEGRAGTRNAMPLFNLAWRSAFFWDGRAPSLRAQVLMPIQNPAEMHETLGRVVEKLQAAENQPENGKLSYSDLFARAFGAPEITADRMARALEQFLLTQVSGNSKFDRFMRDEEQLTEQEQRGMVLFHSEYDPGRRQFGADCFHCHGGSLFQNQPFANNGLDAEPRDLGRFLATGRAGDKGKFAVPSLRNVAVTAPYMHDGRFKTLEEVVEHYSTGMQRSPTLDANLAKHPDGGVPLSASDKQALVAFLKTLTDSPYGAGTDAH